jgi:pSer/pThr/pTyr-binding forkhead associated (FHA) protein
MMPPGIPDKGSVTARNHGEGVVIMPARLIESGATPEEKREIPISKEEFLIGRGVDCDLRLPDSAVSRHHCLIRVRAGEATITDLGSINGTYVNGQRVRSQAVLHSGDELLLDVYRFVVDLENRDGIGWHGTAAADPDMSTCKLRDLPLPRPAGENPA